MSGGRRGLEATLAGIDGQRAIHANVELDPSACITDAMGVGFQLDAVIASETVLSAETMRSNLKTNTVSGLKARGRLRKAVPDSAAGTANRLLKLGRKGSRNVWPVRVWRPCANAVH